jgi:hypothetical protein
VIVLATAEATNIIGVGVLLIFVAAPFVFWLIIGWALAAPAYVFENISVVTAMSRSRELVRDAWWRTYWVLMLTGLISSVVCLVVLPLFGGIAVITGVDPAAPPLPPSLGELVLPAIGTIIVSTLTAPFVIGATGLLYVDQRIRRERYDLELARLAAAPE